MPTDPIDLGDQVHIWDLRPESPGRNPGRPALESVLTPYLERAPEPGEIVTTPEGKPRLADSDLRFNLSHSGGLMLVAITRGREVGIDVERLRPRRDFVALARRSIGAEPAEALASIPTSEREAAFYDAWTRHEAIAKCGGGGLAQPTPPGPVAVEPLAVAPGWAAAIAVEGERVGPVQRFTVAAEAAAA